MLLSKSQLVIKNPKGLYFFHNYDYLSVHDIKIIITIITNN